MKRFIVCAAFLVACGGAAAPAPASTAPSDGERGGSTAAPQSVDAQHTQSQPSNATTRDVAGARSELERAESQLNAATGDCATACRALASMERAAEHLCALDGGHECDRARERLAAARERVRASCGGCSQ